MERAAPAVQGTARALSLEDAIASTRPIRAPEARTPARDTELFDGITYRKTAAVLRMIEVPRGQAFRTRCERVSRAPRVRQRDRRGLLERLVKGGSGKPVDAVMRSFVTQPGAPS